MVFRAITDVLPPSRLELRSESSGCSLGGTKKGSLGQNSESSLAERWAVLIEECNGMSWRLREHPLTRELIKDPIPSSVRAEVWLVLMGALEERDRFGHDYYQQLVRLCDIHGCFMQIQIHKDVERTLPGAFSSKSGRECLERILSAYALRNPDSVGYCQSMNQLAGCLLWVLQDEEDAFWGLVCLIESRMGYYTKSMCELLVDQAVFGDLLSFYEPELYDSLMRIADRSHIDSCTTSWFLCLFVEAPLKLEDSVRFWDKLLL